MTCEPRSPTPRLFRVDLILREYSPSAIGKHAYSNRGTLALLIQTPSDRGCIEHLTPVGTPWFNSKLEDEITDDINEIQVTSGDMMVGQGDRVGVPAGLVAADELLAAHAGPFTRRLIEHAASCLGGHPDDVWHIERILGRFWDPGCHRGVPWDNGGDGQADRLSESITHAWYP